MGQDRTRALCVGFPKSGTTTLYKAFKLAGLNVVHRKRPGKLPEGYILYKSYKRNKRWVGADIITQLDTCRKGINIWPQLDYDFLAWANKHAKLILQLRDPEKILRSIKDHNDLRDRIVYAPGLRGKRTTDEHIITWINRHYKRVKTLFPDILSFQIDDEDAADRISDYLGVELPWWGVANATRRKTLRAKGEEVSSN